MIEIYVITRVSKTCPTKNSGKKAPLLQKRLNNSQNCTSLLFPAFLCHLLFLATFLCRFVSFLCIGGFLWQFSGKALLRPENLMPDKFYNFLISAWKTRWLSPLFFAFPFFFRIPLTFFFPFPCFSSFFFPFPFFPPLSLFFCVALPLHIGRYKGRKYM